MTSKSEVNRSAATARVPTYDGYQKDIFHVCSLTFDKSFLRWGVMSQNAWYFKQFIQQMNVWALRAVNYFFTLLYLFQSIKLTIWKTVTKNNFQKCSSEHTTGSELHDHE